MLRSPRFSQGSPRAILSSFTTAAVVLSLAVGCASPPSASNASAPAQAAAPTPETAPERDPLAEAADRLAFKPRRPGAVLPTMEIAAVNALAYSYLVAHRSRSEESMHGGAITRVEGGYVYSEPRVEGEDGLRIPLGPQDVGHYKTYPTFGRKQDVWGETHSPRDRAVIDRDGRPSYLLTPSLRVMVYRGDGSREEQIASLDDRGSLVELKELAKRSLDGATASR